MSEQGKGLHEIIQTYVNMKGRKDTPKNLKVSNTTSKTFIGPPHGYADVHHFLHDG